MNFRQVLSVRQYLTNQGCHVFAKVASLLHLQASLPSKHAYAGPLWVGVGLLWGSLGRTNPHLSRMGPCGLAHAGPTVVLPFWAPIRVFCRRPAVGLAHSQPTSTPCGLAHVVPTAVLPFLFDG